MGCVIFIAILEMVASRNSSKMDWSNFAIFFAASWILIITPGPDMIYVMTRGISQGRKAGVVSAVGVTLGILVHTLFAAFGLAMVLRVSALAFLIVKLAGAAYLIYLGVKTLLNKSDVVLNKNKSKDGIRIIFIQGILSNVLNPKIALFFLAFLPQFVDLKSGNASIQMAYLGLTFALFGVLFLVLLGYFSGYIGIWLSRRHNWAEKIRWFTGSILIALGLRLAFMDRK
jgi:threonine/homoserine/homoserine lactone efflux protein